MGHDNNCVPGTPSHAAVCYSQTSAGRSQFPVADESKNKPYLSTEDSEADLTADKTTYQLSDVGHLSHIV